MLLKFDGVEGRMDGLNGRIDKREAKVDRSVKGLVEMIQRGFGGHMKFDERLDDHAYGFHSKAQTL